MTSMDYRQRLVVVAPPGPLGMVLNKMCAFSEGCCSVSSVDKSSALHKKVLPGDWLFAIDNVPVRFWSLHEVQSNLVHKSENPVRMLSFLRSPVGTPWPNETLVYTTPGRSIPVSFVPISREERSASPLADAQKTIIRQTKTVSCQTCTPTQEEDEEDEELIRHMPPELRSHLNGEEPQLKHRSEVKAAFIRACELYENTKALETVYKDQRLSSSEGVSNGGTNTEIANSLLKSHLTKWRKEYEAIMSFPDNKLSVQEIRYKELVNFRMEHGHSSVPNKHPNKKLRNWCARVRQRHRSGPRIYQSATGRKRRNKDPSRWDMNFEEDVKLLDRLGFDWNPAERLTEQWEEHVAALKKYKEEHGTVCIPTQKSGPLGRWVINIRKEYNHNVQKGLHSRLTPERIKQLEEIGFVWSMRTPYERTGKYIGEKDMKIQKAMVKQRALQLQEQQDYDEYGEYEECDEVY